MVIINRENCDNGAPVNIFEITSYENRYSNKAKTCHAQIRHTLKIIDLEGLSIRRTTGMPLLPCRCILLESQV